MRAIAVVLVILAHGHFSYFDGGFIGVDVFFVISGYVICGLLIRQGRSKGIHAQLGRFYARRIRRIMPAATLVLLATLVATYYWLGAYTGRTLGTDERWAALFASNFRFIHVQSDYLLSQQPLSLITQYWSLSVEEQFYFVFPLIVFTVVAALGTRLGKGALIGLLGVLTAASSWLCVTQTASSPITAYYSPFTRFWELALGALVLLIPAALRDRDTIQRVAIATIGWVALVAIIASAMVISPTDAYPGSLVWWPVGATAVLLWVGKEQRGWGPELALSFWPMVFIGDISYSLYLWHYPLFNLPLQYSITPTMPLSSRLLQLLAAFVLAILTYFLLENPIRRSKWLDRHQWVAYVMGAVLIGSVFLATGLYDHYATI